MKNRLESLSASKRERGLLYKSFQPCEQRLSLSECWYHYEISWAFKCAFSKVYLLEGEVQRETLHLLTK
jgi:hypothetical protein